MAINVNTVYQTVLLILNKEQRGYMTPVEFNKIGQQVQLEIFEKYFEDLNQQIRIPQTNVDYADRVMSLDEKMAIFKTSGASAYTGGATPFFSLPTANTLNPSTEIIPSTGLTSYTIPNTLSTQTIIDPIVTVNGITQTTGFSFTNNILTFTAAATPLDSVLNINVDAVGPGVNEFKLPKNSVTITIQVGATVSGPNSAGTPLVAAVDTNPANGTFITVNSAQNYVVNQNLSFTNNIVVSGTWVTQGSNPVYKLGVVNFTDGALPIHELERVTRGELYHLLSSNLTKPTKHYPIYLYEDNKLYVYPTTIISGISCDYIKKPVDPIWNFILGTGNSYIYNSSTSVNFEIHETEQVELILKILLYAGVVVKSPEIIQVAAQQVAQENANQQR